MTSVEPDDLEVEEGIDILYSGPKDPIADVVFVHGLTGRGTTSWQKGDVLWPKELLPKQLPNVRIIAWNYNVDVLRFFNSKSKEKSILQHAENLLFDLGGEREEEGRPIIFIGHSLGGLVIKQALVIASQSEHSQDDNTAGYVDIINSTIGIVFLGTPHKGSDRAKWDSIATRLAQMMEEGHNDTIISSLSSGSIFLEQLQSSFTGISDRFAYATLTEERDFPGVGKIVDDESASLYLARETRNSIPANHAEMARFSRPNEIGFKRVVNGLKNLLRVTARMAERGHSKSLPTRLSDMRSMPYIERGYTPYDYGMYTPGRGGIPFNDPRLFSQNPRYPPGFARREWMSPYDDPAYDERGLPTYLNRVSISQAAMGGNTSIDTPTGYHSTENEIVPEETPAIPPRTQSPEPISDPTPHKPTNGKVVKTSDETMARPVEPDEKVADTEKEMQNGEEGDSEGAEDEEGEHFPSPVTRDMFVRLHQELRDKDQAADEAFSSGKDRVLWYRKTMLTRLLKKKAETQINKTGEIAAEIGEEIARTVYGYTHVSARCDLCGGNPPDKFYHCILCLSGDWDMCQKCKDQGKECPGKHPLLEVTKDANATAPVAPEDEPIFPISDASEQFKEDDHETSVRALFLASLLGHEDIVSQIVQWGTDSECDVNIPPDAGTSRVKLTPLGIAIAMRYDDVVSSLLNSEPSMVVFEDTVISMIDTEEGDSESGRPTEEKNNAVGGDTANADSSDVKNSKDEDGDQGDGDDEESDGEEEEEDSVDEKIAMEAIQMAAEHGTAQATKMLLLQWGQDPLPDGYELLHIPEIPDTIETLLNWGANIDETDQKKQRTPLVWCTALNGPLGKIDTLLRRRANPNVQDKYKKTALHYAAISNRVDVVQLLLEYKANIEVEDNLGNSPLQYVVEQPQHFQMAKLLVNKGASLKHKNKAGQDPLDIAVESNAENGETYLMLAGGKVSRWWSKKFIGSK